jgi:hypothetical protein
MSWSPELFAARLLSELRRNDPAAATLAARHQGKTATIGLTDKHGWLPLLRLSNPSGACNVMSLDVRQKDRWAPTFERGTPEMIAKKLLGPLRFTWAMWVEALDCSET